MNAYPKKQTGFTLVEVAIVIIVVGLLLSGAMVTLSAQMDYRDNAETNETLERAREAILTFAAVNGRLPCPDSDGDGEENPVGGGNCAANYNGFVPAKTLGLSPVDPVNKQLIDAWGTSIRYAVTAVHSDAYTTANKIRDTGLGALFNPKIRICSTSICNGSSLTADVLTDEAVVVLFSNGKNRQVDAAANQSNNRFFAFIEPTSANDDLFIWVSPYILYDRMLAAGVL